MGSSTRATSMNSDALSSRFSTMKPSSVVLLSSHTSSVCASSTTPDLRFDGALGESIIVESSQDTERMRIAGKAMIRAQFEIDFMMITD